LAVDISCRFKDSPMLPSSFDKPAALASRGVRRFGRDRRGSAAVEFALVAPVFFALFFAILETGLVFFAGQTLETATQDVSRLVMTGQAQGIGYTQDQFKDEVCKHILGLLDCQNGVYVDVQSYSSFGSVAIIDPVADGKFVPTTVYKPGNACDVVVVRLFYQWPLFVVGLGYDMSNLAGNKRLLIATAAFRNEPFGSGSCT
jgi:Flp pilus assembly protein TadG